MTSRAFCLLVLMTAVCWSPNASAQRALKEGDLEGLNLHAEFVSEANADLVQWSHSFEKPGSRYLRVHFKNIEVGPSDLFVVTIKDRNGRIIAEYDQTKFSTSSSFWTPIVNGSFLRVEVAALKRPRGLSFDVDKLPFSASLVRNIPSSALTSGSQ